MKGTTGKRRVLTVFLAVLVVGASMAGVGGAATQEPLMPGFVWKDGAEVYAFVRTPTGQYTINAKTAPADAAVGDEVSLCLNEENMVVDHHGKEKNKKGMHRLIFGKLIYAGLTKNQIKLQTPEGEKVFPLERMEVKTKPIAEGLQIVVELNEEGTVVDLRKVE